MADEFLSRWSRLKREARAQAPGREAPKPEPAPAAGVTAPAPAEPVPLPPVESLTTESDFTPFMGKDVDPSLRRQALRALFEDPRFNVMDGLDTYIDDYSKPDPIPEDWMGKLEQLARLGHEPDPKPGTADAGEGGQAPSGTSGPAGESQAAATPKPLECEGDLPPPSDTPA